MKIYLEHENAAIEAIKNRHVTVCVIGLGTIGLPVATFYANAGFRVSGIDVNAERVDKIKNGTLDFEYQHTLAECLKSGRLSVSTDAKDGVSQADFIITCVQTPLDAEKNITLTHILAAAGNIAKYLQDGTVLIFESSVTPGTTRMIGKTIEEKSGKILGKDFGLAYCPERYNPGLPKEKHGEVVYDEQDAHQVPIYTLDKINRVMGGVDVKSRVLAKTLYSQIIKGSMHEVSSIEAAEATKLVENIFRDVNIALVNELSKIFSKIGLDTFEIVEAAKTKPFAFIPHYPGAGVGGDCIPVDTWYLIKKADAIGCSTDLMRTARVVNDSMPEYVVGLLEEALSRPLKDCRICILGVSYKKNLVDMRESPSFVLSKLLEKKGASVFLCDPVVQSQNSGRGMSLVPLNKAFDGMDGIVLATDHDVFKTADLEKAKKTMRTPLIIDGRNFFKREKLLSLGFVYRAVGKPN